MLTSPLKKIHNLLAQQASKRITGNTAVQSDLSGSPTALLSSLLLSFRERWILQLGKAPQLVHVVSCFLCGALTPRLLVVAIIIVRTVAMLLLLVLSI